MARPRKAKTLSTVSIRLPKSVLDEIDECAEQLQEETPLLQVTRTDAVRFLIQTALEEFWRKRRKKR